MDPHEALKTLHHALDAGVSFIDTADIYGGGSNEELVAKLLMDRRSDVQLATKFSLVGNPADGYTDVRGDAAYVRQAVDASLRRLGTDVIDLYYMHRRDLRVPIVETVEAMAGLVQQGKVKHLGLGVGFVPYSLLGRGFLTGTVDVSSLGANDFRRRIPRFAEDAASANQAVVAAVQSVAAELAWSPSPGRAKRTESTKTSTPCPWT